MHFSTARAVRIEKREEGKEEEATKEDFDKMTAEKSVDGEKNIEGMKGYGVPIFLSIDSNDTGYHATTLHPLLCF